MKRCSSKVVALSGVLAALGIIIMCLGGMIPVATYVCPTLCAVLCFFVYRFCGTKIAWMWYVAVSVLAVLLGPDKEAAAVFLFLGYYPIIKPALDRAVCSIIWKLLLFNGAAAILFYFQMLLFGVQTVLSEYTGAGIALLCIYLILANVTFFLLDMLLKRLANRVFGSS